MAIPNPTVGQCSSNTPSPSPTSESEDSTTVYPVNNRAKSNVWGFFVKKGARKVSCSICAKDYAYHGGTSNLRDHLVRCHPKEFQPSLKRQPTIETFVSKTKCSASRAKQITGLIVDMVSCDLRPAAIVEGKGFNRLVKSLEPGYKVPSATHISEMVRKKHVAAKQILKDRLQDVVSLSVSTDIWTSCTNEAYISVTGHFINEKWEMASCVLGTCPFPGQHTAVNIVEKLQEVIKSFEFNVDCVKAI